ncbi:MAG: ribosome maturation factor RimM [Eubacteriaceae bacterium]|jgi:16S rRNA processing protein RimM|nr:ribosome maturation factor RimM [Eubacteriaceae bacterium]
MEKIKIGKVASAVGMKGEIKILSYSDDEERFEKLDRIYIGDKQYEIESVRYKGNMPIIKAAGIDDRNASEAAAGRSVFMDESDLEELGEDEHYVRDIIGAQVVTEEGCVLGTLKDITNHAGQDLYEVEKPDGGILLIPGVPAFILDIDEENMKITVRLIEGLADL